MKRYGYFFFSLLLSVNLLAQTSPRSENLIVITMDGLRWQEVFEGADSLLVFDTTASYNRNYIKKHFWAASASERRSRLMPFFWSVLAKQGLLIGNRELGSQVYNANPYWFSYPGYNEIFTGFPDTAVNSNDKNPNKNVTVFEWLSKMPAFKGKAAVFGSWDVFSYIFNEKRSGLLVNDGFRDVAGKLNEKQKMLNELQHQMPDIFHGGERIDAATFQMGFEYLKSNRPRLMFFGLGDTDEFAHAGLYDMYLDAAQNADEMIRLVWEWIQSTPEYKDKTTLIVTTDHGRGLATEGNWRHHGQRIPDSKEMWIAAIGPSIPAKGESNKPVTVYQGQIAASIAQLLGYEFKPHEQPVLAPLNWSLF